MNKTNLPTSRIVLPTFQTFCPFGVQIAQTVIHFAHFQVQSKKRGVLGWAWGCFVYVHIQEKGLKFGIFCRRIMLNLIVYWQASCRQNVNEEDDVGKSAQILELYLVMLVHGVVAV